MFTIPFNNLHAQYESIQAEIDPAIRQVISTTSFVLGPAVEAFEKDFAAYCETDYCIAMNSGTAAIALLLQAHGIGAGDEVITVTNSFFASAAAIAEIGATPVLVDCTEETALMDPDCLEAAITDRTKAILPVHLYGQPANMDRINAIAKKHNLLVFEDACQAHGARYKGKRAGSLANGAAFSFYPGKNLGAYGEGGAVVTNDPAINMKLRLLREHGSPKKYVHTMVGWNERMDGIQGAVLGVKLRHLEAWNTARKKHAETYRSLLGSSVRSIGIQEGSDSVYHLFVVRVPNRDAVKKVLAEKGIETLIHYPTPIHLQEAFRGKWKNGDFPHAEKLSGDILSLPMFPELTEEQINEVVAALKAAL